MKLPTITILCGGLGTRIEQGNNVPKSLITIANKPFIFYQLELLSKNGFKNVVLCVGHLANKIIDVVGTQRFGLKISYSIERTPLGTAGAIKKALPLLGECFFVMYGDSYLPVDFVEVGYAFVQLCWNKSGMMTVYKNQNKYDKSNVLYRDGRIIKYGKKSSTTEMEHIDYGLSVFNKEAFDVLKPNIKYDLSEVYNHQHNRIMGYEMKSRFYEIGSPEGLKDFEEYITKTKGN